MDKIFIKSKNYKPSEAHRVILNLLDKINLKMSDKYVALLNLRIYYKWKNIKTSYKNNIFSNMVFELPDKSYSVSGIQNHFECIIKKS